MKRTSKKSTKKTSKVRREQILKSMLASFKIEGINIPLDFAQTTLKNIQINPEK